MEYRNLRENIYPEEFNDRAEGIVNWIKENRDKFDETLYATFCIKANMCKELLEEN